MAVDPVCGREIDPVQVNSRTGSVVCGASETDARAGTKIFHSGQWRYFCSMACRAKFLGNPEKYLEQPG